MATIEIWDGTSVQLLDLLEALAVGDDLDWDAAERLRRRYRDMREVVPGVATPGSHQS